MSGMTDKDFSAYLNSNLKKAEELLLEGHDFGHPLGDTETLCVYYTDTDDEGYSENMAVFFSPKDMINLLIKEIQILRNDKEER